jgi:predicted transcriptional regulator
VKRTQIYLGDEQTRLLDRRASAKGTTRSELIRDAVDQYLARDGGDDGGARLARFKQAVREAAGIAAHLPPGERYVAELREADRRREEELERRRRA